MIYLWYVKWVNENYEYVYDLFMVYVWDKLVL